jgi:hypothetical protein
MGSTMIFFVGDVSMLFHFSFTIPLWIRVIMCHCKGWIQVVVCCTFLLVKVFSSPCILLYVSDNSFYFLLKEFFH